MLITTQPVYKLPYIILKRTEHREEIYAETLGWAMTQRLQKLRMIKSISNEQGKEEGTHRISKYKLFFKNDYVLVQIWGIQCNHFTHVFSRK